MEQIIYDNTVDKFTTFCNYTASANDTNTTNKTNTTNATKTNTTNSTSKSNTTNSTNTTAKTNKTSRILEIVGGKCGGEKVKDKKLCFTYDSKKFPTLEEYYKSFPILMFSLSTNAKGGFIQWNPA